MTMTALLGCGGSQSLKSGIDLANLDTTVSAGTDFYNYATGGWQKNNPIPAEYSRYGSFDVLAQNNVKQLRELIEEIASKENEAGSLADKIAKMYNSAMDSVKLNAEGIEPIREDLEEIAECKTKEELFEEVTELSNEGVSTLFGFYIDADEKNSKNNLLQLISTGLVLGEKEYYLDNDEATLKIRGAYIEYLENLMAACNVAKDAEAKARVANVIALETRLAQATRTKAEMRDPEKNYNKFAYADFVKTFPGLDWKEYFDIVDAEGVKEVGVGQPETLHEIEAIWNETSLDVLKDYSMVRLMIDASSYLNDELRALTFGFFGKVKSGSLQDRPRWKRAVASTEGALGEAIGQLYVEKYFPAAAKDRMIQLVKNLQVALGERIDAQDWMSDSTKAVAHEKLNAFLIKVGYPDKWRDYSELEIGNCYWENLKHAAEWESKDMIARKLNKPVDNSEWYMTPQTVNAYYNPTTNEICFPAGILQPPFFDMDADDAFNYGAIGVVIGHEMTHGFDDQGSKYDKDGNLRQWWTPEDTERFTARTLVLKDFFDKIEVLPGLFANGSLTLGENMADHGGIMVAYQAFQNVLKEGNNDTNETKDGFTPEQRFFLAYSNVWAANIRDEEIRNRTKSDPHSLGRWRVNGTLPHINAWYDAFNITEKDPMYVAPDKRANVW